MLLLAIDTSGRQGGITLARGDSELEIVESTPIQGGTFSAELIPQIAELLGKHHYSARQLGGLVAVTGPGSFTGLRIGLTAVKGLAEVLKLPIATLTALEVLFAAAGAKQGCMAILDAGRGELYAAIPKKGKRDEVLLSGSEAIALAQAQGLRIVAGEAVTGLAQAEVIRYCSTEVAARLGFAKLRSGETEDVLALDANYIRRSEAEYKQKAKK